MKNFLIVIAGLPWTGKTTLWKSLSEKLSLPFFSKDIYKEILFDSLWSNDRIWSKKLWSASYDILYSLTDSILASKLSCIIETNFDPKFANEKLRKFKKSYDINIVQIFCRTDEEVLYERFKDRALHWVRHPWHQDKENLEEWKKKLTQWYDDFLDVDYTYTVDTTNFLPWQVELIIQYINTIH